jgi:hypothetical protein
MEHHMSEALILLCRPSDTRALLTWGRENHRGRFWTPTISRLRRLPRSRKQVRIDLPALPGYLFMMGTFPPGLQATLQRKHVRQMNTLTGPASCKISELEALREAVSGKEAELLALDRPPEPPTFTPGQRVIFIEGAHLLSGLEVEIVSQNLEEVTVQSAGIWGKLKVSAFLLEADGL